MKMKMNLFYSLKYSAWEYDFFKNDLFSPEVWKDICPIDFVLYDETIDVSSYTETRNILVFNEAFSKEKIRQLLADLKPIVVFHLSDEGAIFSDMCPFLTHCSQFYFHQYHHAHYDYSKKAMQIPLGYVKNFCSGKPSTDLFLLKSHERQYQASFIGQMKSDRQEMCRVFQQGMDNTCIVLGNTQWCDPELSNTKPNDMFDIYQNTQFVLVGRGNIRLDCFRIYEDIVAGAIPVVVGSPQEIDMTFEYGGLPPLLMVGETWEDALQKCKNCGYSEQDRIREINSKWWKLQIHTIQQVMFRALVF